MPDLEDQSSIQIPDRWKEINLPGLHGVVMIVGEADTGKTTFAKYLFSRLVETDAAAMIAYLDGDPGQSSLGPPTTLTVALSTAGKLESSGDRGLRRYFAGSTSPYGHFLEMVVGASRLWAFAQQTGAHTLVLDTSGLVSPQAGGPALKHALVEVLQPTCLFAIQRAGELEPMLVPLRKSGRAPIFELSPSPAVQRRSATQRRRRRREQFAFYFESARHHRIHWARFGVFPGPRFVQNRLIAFEDREGFLLGLGIVTGNRREMGEIEVLTPLDRFDSATGIRLGDVSVDPVSFFDGPVQAGYKEEIE